MNTAKILKKFIKQPRPVGARKYEKTYGMPSTHSSSISFFGTYLSLSSLLLPLHPRVTSLLPFYDTVFAPLGPGAVEASFWRSFLSHWGERMTRIALAVFFLAGAGSVCWSRVRLGHHTRAQVIAGISLGSCVALFWMTLWLGIVDASKLAGFSSVSLESVAPEWLRLGAQDQARIWERAIEDAIFVGLDAWRTGRWHELKAIGRFPIAEL